MMFYALKKTANPTFCWLSRLFYNFTEVPILDPIQIQNHITIIF